MKYILMLFSIIILRCCWGPTDFQLMLQKQDDNAILKELSGNYKINTLEGENVSSYKLGITFNDSTKQVSGFSGCNRFFGQYILENNSLKFNSLGSTKMMCSGDANIIEANFFKALEKASLVMFKKDEILLYNKKNFLLSATKEATYSALKLEYKALSRGVYKHIIINEETISTVNKRDEKPIIESCNQEVWNKLTTIFKTIDIGSISNLEAPSKDRFFDGAAIANLKIIYKDSIYSTPSFDHGNPPQEIALLVKEMLSISQNIE